MKIISSIILLTVLFSAVNAHFEVQKLEPNPIGAEPSGFKMFVTEIVNWNSNQLGIVLFYFLYHICILNTMFFTFFGNDEGIAFYKCFNTFPARVTFL
jgi:hypothetical protein